MKTEFEVPVVARGKALGLANSLKTKGTTKFGPYTISYQKTIWYMDHELNFQGSFGP